ncbi:MAG: lipoprotein [Streptococcus sp.]
MKKILLTILSLFLLTGCFSFRESLILDIITMILTT